MLLNTSAALNLKLTFPNKSIPILASFLLTFSGFLDKWSPWLKQQTDAASN